MNAQKIEKLKSIGHIQVSAQEIAEVHEKLASGSKVCETICEWMERKELMLQLLLQYARND